MRSNGELRLALTLKKKKSHNLLPLLFEVKGPYYVIKYREMFLSGMNAACFTHLYILLFISLLIHFIALIKTRVCHGRGSIDLFMS